jgi:hypothetical protein
VHNPIPEICDHHQYIHSHDHAILFEKKVFEEVIFLLKYHQKPPSPQETEHKKKKKEKNY